MDVESLPDYEYSPLCAPDAVRVLALEPALVFEEPLICEIIQYSRSEFLRNPDNTAHYTAVSYTWGQPIFSEYVLCNKDASKLKITPNVDCLLRHLRKKHKHRYLWLDAICLNQANKEEKAAQIPLMGDIYEYAKKVHIWLGPGDDSTSKAFAFLRAAAPIIKDSSNMYECVLELVEQVFGGHSVDQIEKLLLSPWFTRRWVIQEAKFAMQATVHCGNNQIQWQVLVAAFEVLRAVAGEASENFQLSDGAVEALNIVGIISGSDERNIGNMLWNCHASDCRDPEDRFLSLYGLIPSNKNKVPFNYDIYWTDLYRRSFLLMLKSEKDNDSAGRRDFNMLTHILAFGSLSRDGKSPSWVPDWSSHRQHTKFLTNANPFAPRIEMPYYGYSRLDGVDFEFSGPLKLDAQELTLKASSFCPVGQPIVKVPPNFTWRDVVDSLSHLLPSFHSGRGDECKERLVFLISQMLHLRNPAKVRSDYILKHTSERERERFSGKQHHIAIYLLFRDLVEVLDHIGVEGYQWSSRQIYVLTAVGQLLESYSIFCAQEWGTLGIGPQSLQDGDLIAPLNTRLMVYVLDFVERVVSSRRDGIVLRLDNLNDLEGNKFKKAKPKARILGPCFSVFDYRIAHGFEPQIFTIV